MALADKLGSAIGRRGWSLVYGGGRAGLMGAVADAALAHGANVLGVIPESLMQREVGHLGLTELVVVKTMHQRKQLMAERSDAFLAMPGGIGTFEELFEVWTWRHLGYHRRPIGLLNCQGYWQSLLDFLQRSCAEGFIHTEQMAMVHMDDEVESMLDWIGLHGTSRASDEFSQI
jgi:uncharacterized protein (TIGR00730 family)